VGISIFIIEVRINLNSKSVETRWTHEEAWSLRGLIISLLLLFFINNFKRDFE
jgi:hypothetical protein